MFNNQPSEVTDLSGVSFKIDSPSVNTGDPGLTSLEPATPSQPAESKEAPAAEEKPVPATPESNSEIKSAPEPTAALTTENTPVPSPQKLDPSSDEVKSLLSDVSKGKLTSFEEVNQKIARLEELEANPSLLFKNDHEKKIFEFLNKYQGDDYAEGIQNFVRLQQMDIGSMDAKSALREVYVLENSKMGISKEKAEQMFEYEYNEKYESKGDIGKAFEERDSYQAKQKLSQMKEDTLVPKAEEQPDQAAQEREFYLSAVDNEFKKGTNPLKDLTISFSDDPNEDYTFPIKDPVDIQQAVANFGSYFHQEYFNPKTGWDIAKLKVDVAFMKNKEAILQNTFEHGVNAGIERKIKERTNTITGTAQVSNASQAAAPVSLEQSILNGIKGM